MNSTVDSESENEIQENSESDGETVDSTEKV